jgi:outer membrane receptor protein involved in Fe transport
VATQEVRLVVMAAAAGAVTLLVWSGDAPAQDGDLEDILVTGSRIARPDFDAPSPLVSLPAAAFEQTAAVSVERTLNTLPQFAASATGTTNDPANDGQANVSLRGIGVAQTLVLLDGRRLMPADGRGSPDLNVLPPALISSVEVVTGGASAAYGSDAIAGVVNFKLKDEFQGVQVDGQWSQTGQGDGQEYTVGLTAGTSFIDGRGSLMGYVGYTERDQVNQGDRRFSRYPLQYFPDEKNGIGPRNAFIASGSTIVEAGDSVLFSNPAVFSRVFASYGYDPGTVPYQALLGVNPDGTLFAFGDGTPGSVANVRREQDPALVNDRYYTYNLAPTTALQMPLERTSLFVHGTFEFSPEAEGYVQALYSDYSVNRQLAPVDAGIMLIPVTNPYIPADLRTLLASRANPAAPFRFFKRITEIGPRVAQNDRELMQVTLGVRGRVYDDWQYEVYAQLGHNDRTEKQTGNVLISRFEELSFAADGGRSICGQFNPFQVGTISPQCADYISVTGSHQATADQTLAEASISGPLLALPAGELRTAFGVFYKDDEFRFKPAEGLSAYLPEVPGVIGARPDLTGFPSAAPRSGSQSNTDLYVEALAPILRDVPGIDSLELGLGYRYSEYSIAGNADSYKAELMYRPFHPVLLRGSIQHAVRAPSIDELYYPQLSNQFVVPRPDPCSVNSDQRTGKDKASVEALCLAQGLPAALLPTYAFELRRVNGVSGGNPQLEAEQADTYTFGVVLTSPFDHAALRHLQVSLDWYSIDLQDAIGRWDSESAVNRCYDAAYNPDFQANNIYCTFFTRDTTTGEMFARIIDSNIGGVDTSGVDLQVDWSMEAGPGRLGANFYLTHVKTWKYSDPSGGTIEYAGTIGGGGVSRALPEWKSLLSLSYGWRDVQLVARWQFIDAMTDAIYRNDPVYPDFEVPSRNYLDLGASITFAHGTLEGLTARVGVDNATDTDPPVFPSYTQANTDPAVYDVLGRRYYLSLAYHF